ncbi:MAG: arginine--tRNA ligase, partial [Nanobdellota archaeon]
MDFKEKIKELLTDHVSEEHLDNLERPKDTRLGDYAFPCFVLAKEMKKNPAVIVEELAGKLSKPDFIRKIENNGPYLNFFIDSSYMA